jgi:hypothetical protein
MKKENLNHMNVRTVLAANFYLSTFMAHLQKHKVDDISSEERD